VHTGATRRYTVSLAGRQQELSVPADNVTAEIVFTDFPALPDLRVSLFDALEHPIGCVPLSAHLRPGFKVAIPVGSRVTDWMLGVRHNLGVPLLDYLNRAGIRDEDVTFLYAAGLHPTHRVEERFGRTLLGRARVMVHDPRDEASLAYCGVTSRGTPVWVNRIAVEANVVLGFGEISPTVQGGWCGGGKIVLPGIAGKDTIETNHAYTLVPQNTLFLADRNHMRLDMEEAADLARLTIKVDILINSREEIVALYAGDFRKAHRAALPMAREIWLTKMKPTHVAVVYPNETRERYLSTSLFGCLEASDWATKEDGTIILVLSAVGGWGPPEKVHGESCGPEILKMPIEEIARRIVRRQGYIRGTVMLYGAKKMLNKKRVILVSEGISHDDAKEFGFAHSARSFEEALSIAFAQHGPAATISMNLTRGVGWRCGPWIED
jgi:nickel-dependent lactate racemase